MLLRAESAMVEFWIVVGTKLHVVSISSHAKILDAFEYLKARHACINADSIN